MSSEDALKQEKLALAKKKLKQYQEKQHVSSRQSVGSSSGGRDQELASSDYLALRVASVSPSNSTISSPAAYFMHENNGDDGSSHRFTKDQHHRSSMDPYQPRRPSVGSHSSAAFSHDDQRSPFQRVQRPSGSSEGRSRHSSIFQQEQAINLDAEDESGTSGFDNMATYASSRWTAPPVSTTTHFQAAAASYFSDGQEQQYSVPLSSNESFLSSFSMDQNTLMNASNDVTLVPYGGGGSSSQSLETSSAAAQSGLAQFNPVLSATGDARIQPSSAGENTSLHSSGPASVPETFPRNSQSVQLPYSSTNVTSSDFNASQLSLQVAGKDSHTFLEGSKVTSDQSMTVVSQQHSQISNIPSAESRGSVSEHGQTGGMIQNSSEFLEKQAEERLLRKQFLELQEYSRNLVSEFQTLQQHYASLHAAYSALVDNSQQQTAQLNSHREAETKLRQMEAEVKQHLNTMSVLVHEKTEYQSKLKHALDSSNVIQSENEELKGRLKSNRERIVQLEKELETTSRETKEAESTQRRRIVELDHSQKELTDLREKLAAFQLETRELAAKLRSKTSELDTTKLRLSDLENQLQMSQIYLRQVTGSETVDSALAAGTELAHLRTQKEQLDAELRSTKEQYGRVLHDASHARIRFETYVAQLTEQLNAHRTELQKLNEEKVIATRKVEGLEIQLEEYKNKLKQGVQSQEEDTENDQHQLELAQVSRAHTEQMINLKHSYEMDISELREKLQHKEAELQHRTLRVLELNNRVESLQEEIKEMTGVDKDTSSLVQTLQNEKATVSRAVAQNVDLKQQLTELQDRFVKMSEESMESNTKLQSLEHVAEQLRLKVEEKDKTIDDLNAKFETEKQKLSEDSAALARQEFDRAQLVDQLRHYEISYKTTSLELLAAKNELIKLSGELNSLKNANPVLTNVSADNSVPFTSHVPSESDKSVDDQIVILTKRLEQEVLTNDGLRQHSDSLRTDLTRLQGRFDHIARENLELHRIMEQNSEDENQNSIRVELQNALDRINSLGAENQELRRALEFLEQERSRFQQGVLQVTSSGQDYSQFLDPLNAASPTPEVNGDDRSSVCSDHIFEQKEKREDTANSEALLHVKNAMALLQDRFTKAMNESADLADRNQQLEHLIVQLQAETDCVGEYITIYQHQRQKIRERMREKDEYIARLSRENEMIKSKLSEIQELVMKLLHERGGLVAYSKAGPPRRGRSTRGNLSGSTNPSRHRSPRKLSETIVDETTGEVKAANVLSSDNEEQQLNDDVNALTNTTVLRSQSVSSDGTDTQSALESSSFSSSSLLPPLGVIVDETEAVVHKSQQHSPGQANTTTNGDTHHYSSDNENNNTNIAERILGLLNDLQTPNPVDKLPLADRNLHCKYCRGRLQVL